MRKLIAKLERLIFHLQQLKTDTSSLLHRSHAAAASLVGFFHPALWPLAVFIVRGVFERLFREVYQSVSFMWEDFPCLNPLVFKEKG